MTNLTIIQIARLTAMIEGGGHKRTANKAKAIEKFTAAMTAMDESFAVEDGACIDLILSLPFDEATLALVKVIRNDTQPTVEEAEKVQAVAARLAAEVFAGTVHEGKKSEDPGLGSLGEWGVGVSEKSAECPHCGINHLDNGFQVHIPGDFECVEREFCCLGCNGEWGKLIARRKSASRNSPSRGMKIYVCGGAQAANPYRAGSKSHSAFEFVQKNGGTAFEDLKAFNVRIRTVTECLKNGTMRRSDK
jgi:hypothetical protein